MTLAPYADSSSRRTCGEDGKTGLANIGVNPNDGRVKRRDLRFELLQIGRAAKAQGRIECRQICGSFNDFFQYTGDFVEIRFSRRKLGLQC